MPLFVAAAKAAKKAIRRGKGEALNKWSGDVKSARNAEGHEFDALGEVEWHQAKASDRTGEERNGPVTQAKKAIGDGVRYVAGKPQEFHRIFAVHHGHVMLFTGEGIDVEHAKLDHCLCVNRGTGIAKVESLQFRQLGDRTFTITIESGGDRHLLSHTVFTLTVYEEDDVNHHNDHLLAWLKRQCQ